jgi:hypothetical protein
MNSSIALPANAYLHFAHAYGFEDANFDGGVLEYSTNGGVNWSDAGALIQANGYGGTISALGTNPLGGRSAFISDSHGYISSRVNLSSLAGQSVRFRWRMGLDDTIFDMGWWVDDVQIYTCSGAAPTSSTVYLPVVIKNFPTPTPTGPTPGFWDSAYDEFYVTADRAYVDNFATYISVGGCGYYKITHTPLEPISNNQFSFGGAFYASGTFNSTTTASGIDGLSSLYIPGCGYVSGGPWSWSAVWVNNSQPSIREAQLVQLDRSGSMVTGPYRVVELSK